MLFPFIFICFFPLSLYPILHFQQSSLSFPLSYPLFSFVLFPCFPYIVFYFNVLSFFPLFSLYYLLFSTSYPSFPCFPYIIFYFQRLILLFPYPILIFIYPFSLFSHILSFISLSLFLFYKENYQFLSLKWYTFIFGVFFISIYIYNL